MAVVASLPTLPEQGQQTYSGRFDIEGPAILGNPQVGRDLNITLGPKKDEVEEPKIRQWLNELSPLNFWKTQNDIYKKREKDTGAWALSDRKIHAWITETGSRLFCPAGAGKSVFSSIVFHHLRRSFPQVDEVGVAVVYCNYKEGNSQSLDNMINSITKQLAWQCSRPPAALGTAYRGQLMSGAPLGFDEHQELLTAIIEHFDRVFLVVDALDEYRDESTAASFINTIQNLPLKASVMVTSRNDEAISCDFSDWPKLEIVPVKSDVHNSVLAVIRRSKYLKHFVQQDPAFGDAITSGIWNRCQGMFLLAQRHIEALTGYDNRRDIEVAIETLPITLFDSFDDTMLRIGGQNFRDRAKAYQVLMWVWASSRPLTVDELQHALALQSGETLLDDNSLPIPTVFGSVCAGLVKVDAERNVVQLVHETLQTYFDENCQRWFPNAHQRITETCLRYLSLDNFATGPRNSIKMLEFRLKRFALLEYAAKYWGIHAKKSPESSVVDSVIVYLGHDQHLASALQVQYGSTSGIYWYNDYPRPVSPIWVAASFGLDATVAKLLETMKPLELTPLYLALYFALANEHDESSQLLYELLQQADVQARVVSNGSQWPCAYSAIHLAVDSGDQRVLRRLLTEGLEPTGADDNSEDDVLHQYAASPLYLALTLDHYAVARLLVQSGALILRSSPNRTIFHEIARLDDEEALTLLIYILEDLEFDSPPDLEEEDGIGFTALHIAVCLNHLATARLLLSLGSDTETRTWQGKTALHIAAQNGHRELVCGLLEAEANFEATDSNMEIPLELAARAQHWDCVDVLFEDRNSVRGDSVSNKILWVASAAGKEYAVLSLLLECNVDLEECSPSGHTALQEASSAGHPGIVTLLLVAGANIDARTDINTLMATMASRPESSFSVTTTKSVEAEEARNLQDGLRGVTALHCASARGHADVVEVLLNAGADIEACWRGNIRALYIATFLGHIDVVKILLQYGASLGLVDVDHSGILSSALIDKRKDIALLFLQTEGAPPDALEEAWSLLKDQNDQELQYESGWILFLLSYEWMYHWPTWREEMLHSLEQRTAYENDYESSDQATTTGQEPALDVGSGSGTESGAEEPSSSNEL